MVVYFTANIGLAKPDDFEVARNWALASQLQDDNNIILENETTRVLASYTPSIQATTTPPNLGITGYAIGEYQDLEGFIQGHMLIEWNGSGVSAGSGDYLFSLPQVADPVFHTVGTILAAPVGPNSIVGEGWIYDASAAATSGSCAIDLVTVSGVSYGRMLTESYTSPTKTSRLVGSALPFVPVAGDKYVLNYMYKKQ